MERTTHFRYTSLSLILALIGVYSGPAKSFAYPLSNENYTASNSTTIKMTRSSRDVASAKTTKSSAVTDNSDSGPLSPGSHNLAIGVGQVFLLGKTGNTYENALGEELHYTYGVSELFDFEVNGGYSSHSSGNFSVWHLAADVRTNLAYYDQLVPFFTAGLGFYDPSYTLANGATVSSLLFGMQLGTGIDLLISKQVFFGARLTYHDVFNSSKKASDGNAYDLGTSYVSFLLHIGYTFN